MKKYKVMAPFLVFSVKVENGKAKEHTVKLGDKIELPENDLSVRALVLRKQLREVEDEPVAAGKAPGKKPAE